MAAIGKIREKSGLLIFIIGLAMVAFIMGDLFSNRQGRPEYIVGEIHGEPVSGVEYEYLVNDLVEGLRSTGQRLTEADRDQVRAQVWNDLVKNKVMGTEIAELGLDVTPEEYNDIRFGSNILPEFISNPNFKNQETGQFDPQVVRNYFLALQANYPLYLKNQRRSILNARLYTKYLNLLKKGITVNSIDAEDRHFVTNSRVDFDFVLKRFNEVPDASVEIVDADLKEYYNAHKNDEEYKQVASRSIDYVLFDVVPSAEDKADQKARLANIKSDFSKTANDTSFVIRNSEAKTFATQSYKIGTDSKIDAAFADAKVGSVVGPYEQNNAFKLVKVLAVTGIDEVNARHILLKAKDGEAMKAVKKRAEALRKDIKRNNNFAEVAKEKSEDTGSGAKGGDLGWFGQGAMVAEFNDACFNNKKGAMPIVETQFGIHLIEITDKRTASAFELAVVENAIKPSKKTYDAAYDAASEFSIQYSTPDAFDAGIAEKGYSLRKAENIKTGDRFVSGIPNARPIINWVMAAEIGAVSEPIELEDKFIVSLLTEIKEAGVPAFMDVKSRVEVAVRTEKKAEFIKAELAGVTDLSAAATKLGKEVQKANNLNLLATSIPGGGANEAAVIGEVFTLEVGGVSAPVTGLAGVYMLKLNRKAMAEAKENYTADQKVVATSIANRLEFESFNALKTKAAVKDQRNSVQ